MGRLCVFEHSQVFTPYTGVPEFTDGSRRIAQKQPLELGVDPSSRHHSSAIAGTDLMLEIVDDLIESCGVDNAFLDQERLQCFYPKGCIGGDGLMFMRLLLGSAAGRSASRTRRYQEISPTRVQGDASSKCMRVYNEGLEESSGSVV